MKTSFKDSKLGQWLKANVPSAIGIVENFVPAPAKGALDIVKNVINNEPAISPAQKEEGINLAEIYEQEYLASLGDVADARKREIALKDRMPAILALTVVVGFFAIIAVLILIPIPAACEKILYILLGTLSAKFGTVYDYYFGSSTGSAKKQETIDAMMSQQ